MIKDRISQLRRAMKNKGIDAYFVPTADFHESEYVGDYFKCREYITGFTGSAGTAVITAEEAGLWSDGRYFIQAANELRGSGVTLFKMGQESVPDIDAFLKDKLPDGGTLGFDGRVVNASFGNHMEEVLKVKDVKIAYEEDLIGQIWSDRPKLSCEPAFLLDFKYAGKSAADKVADVRKAMKEKGATRHILTSLPDINWLFNIRGNDICSNPVVLSYAVISEDEIQLFVQEEAVSHEVREQLSRDGVVLRPYEAVYEYAAALPEGDIVLLDSQSVNYKIYRSIPKGVEIQEGANPTLLPKACKNPVEVENMKKAHIKDGVAVTKFMYWLKKNIGRIPISELSAASVLEDLRKQQEGFIEPSFQTISAYGDNAAMCHYSATEESDRSLQPEGLYLVDSGGHYFEGTTDITRTFVLGPVTKEMKMHFTLVAAGMLRLGNAKFLYGTRGINLDYTARGPLWEKGLDYNHGTGHGVGYLLSVHEPPNGIRWKMVPERMDSEVLEEGMITSDEPGLYFEGSHGIRTENLIVCKKAEHNEYGQFMEFEYLTYAPIDLDGIDTGYLNSEDKELLNRYHKAVFDKISPYLSHEEAEWLREYTREI